MDLRNSLMRERQPVARYEVFYGIRHILILDVHCTALKPQFVSAPQDLGMCVSGWRFELVASQFDPVTQRVAKVDGPHKSPIDAPGIGNSAFVQAVGDLVVSREADLERDVMGRPDLIGDVANRRPVFRAENRDQTPVARIEIEMTDFGSVEIGLFEHERHPEDAFPEVDAGLAIRPVEGDMVYALRLYPSHLPPRSSNRRFFKSLRHITPNLHVWRPMIARKTGFYS